MISRVSKRGCGPGTAVRFAVPTAPAPEVGGWYGAGAGEPKGG